MLEDSGLQVLEEGIIKEVEGGLLPNWRRIFDIAAMTCSNPLDVFALVEFALLIC